MKVQLTPPTPPPPRWKFVCDRCAKEIYPNEKNCIPNIHEIAFVEIASRSYVFINPRKEVCEDCYNDFIELANNFFDEVNKVESES